MPNFIITNVCNLSCPFCFAAEHIDGEQQGGAGRMSVEEFSRQLAFIGDQPARFCGGEPTLHPDFIEMMTVALARPKGQVFLMTNGVWPAPVREHIRGLSRSAKKRVGYLFNVLESSHYRPEQEASLHETLAMVERENATLGCTLYDPSYDYAHLFQLVDRFRFKRVRYSVASPTVTDPRSWLVNPERDFPGLATIVHALTMQARARGIYIHSDCGYLPPCMFTAEQLHDLYPKDSIEKSSAFSCNGPIDIGPGGETWRCYGLYSTMRTNTADFENSIALGEYFEARTRETHFTPLFDACDTCELREPYKCAGGCYALRSAKGMQHKAEESLVQIGPDASFFASVPRLTDQIHIGDTSVMLCEQDGTWSRVALSEWETALLLACDGARSVADVAKHADPQKPRTAVAARVLRRFFEQGALSISATGPR